MILAFFYGQSRIFFTMARDGLLPPSLARVSSRGTPVRITIFTAIVVVDHRRAGPAGRRSPRWPMPGRWRAFVAVCAAMLVLRVREPDRAAQVHHAAAVGGRDRRDPRLPLSVRISLPAKTQLFFLRAKVIGLVLYAIYGSRAAERRERTRG